MSTVPASSSPFNLASFANHLLAGPCADAACRPGGHVDEATAMLSAEPADDIAPGEMLAGLEEWDTDRCIQAADDDHLATLRRSVHQLRDALGATVQVSVSRMVSIAASGKESSDWSFLVYTSGFSFSGVAVNPAAAVQQLLADVDAKAGIVPSFNGYRVPGVALILSTPDRSKADAMAMARRVALDSAYLDTLLNFRVYGVIDERNPSPPANVAA